MSDGAVTLGIPYGTNLGHLNIFTEFQYKRTFCAGLSGSSEISGERTVFVGGLSSVFLGGLDHLVTHLLFHSSRELKLCTNDSGFSGVRRRKIASEFFLQHL